MEIVKEIQHLALENKSEKLYPDYGTKFFLSPALKIYFRGVATLGKVVAWTFAAIVGISRT